MRELVQRKRTLALEKARKEETVLRLQEDRKIRQEVRERGNTGGSPRPPIIPLRGHLLPLSGRADHVDEARPKLGKNGRGTLG